MYRALALWALVLGLALTGCGSGSSSDGDPPPPDSGPQTPDDDPPTDDPPDDPPSQAGLTFTVDDVSVTEGSDTVTFIVRAEGDAAAGEAQVDYTTVDGSALAGLDYVATQGTLVFDGPGEQTVAVSVVDDDEPEGEETFQLEISNPVNGEIAGATGVATIADDDADVCSQPTFDEATDAAAFLWKHCPTGTWRLRATAAEEPIQYQGQVRTAEAFDTVIPVQVEPGDVVDNATPNQIDFSLAVDGDTDGFNFVMAEDVGTCFELSSPAGGEVLVGGQRLARSGAFDLGTLGPCEGAGAGDAQGYNIVVVLTDDQRFDTLEHMPNLVSRLMPIGVEFENAYVPTPLCCPARASFYAGGFLSQNTGVLNNSAPNGGMEAFDDENNIGRQLQQAGYRTQFVGKWFNDYIRFAPYVPPGWDSFVGRDAWGNEDWKNFPYVTASSEESSTVGDRVSSAGQYHVYFERDRIIEFIESQPPGEDSEPYFVLWATTPPHGPSTPDEMDADAFADFTYRGRGVDEDDLSDKPKWVQDYASNPHRPIGNDEQVRDQLRSMLPVDRGLSEIIDVVEARGEMDRTVFVFLSDNGYMWGEHGIWAKNKAYDESIRVPLLVVVPGIEARTEQKLVYAVLDVPATILDLAGVSGESDGESLLPLLEDPNAEWRNELFFEKFAEAPGQDAIWAGLIRDNWKYISYVGGSSELYDLEADPYELENLAENSAYADIRDSMKSRLEERMAVAIKPPPRTLEGQVGEPFSLALEPWGGHPPFEWSLASGELPPGIEIDAATGEIRGTPTTAGSWTFAARVTSSEVAAYTGAPRTFVTAELEFVVR